ncbi:two-component system regulatory protein YycI [Acidaminobacter hydrogenoformans]|uniref:YycH protein n=1 Tax=Acidaminobacter hydrogenoformans DSM 2784 TaxID=1120920 RepID=A0A1G5RRH6_9FIRM|nr:two-component system regulatory protein YycI [Acidaminobacter hydrogenoformans]SCZ76586.1 YycH protein [Acidaminobacter hydrogenoformans DSM 2784]
MDWKKSKNILIIALILTNIALFVMTGGMSKLIDRESAQDPLLPSVLSLLDGRGIGISAAIPAMPLTINAVDLEYNEIEAQTLANALLPGGYEAIDGLYVGHDGALLVVAIEREIRFELPLEQWQITAPLDDAQAWQTGEAFLSALGFDHDDRQRWALSVEPDHVILEWRQSYGSYFLEEAFMRIRLTGDKVVSFERRWFNPPQPQENVHKVIQPSKALFLAAEEIAASEALEDQAVKIDAIELGYQLETGSLTSDITSGEASPYWRMRLSDGRVIFVEAVE